METYIAFLRGINVGGNNILPMSELKSICTNIGFKNVRTYIQSGNVIFESGLSENEVIKQFESALYLARQKDIAVIIRTAKELNAVISRNPFPDAKPSWVGVTLFTAPLPGDMLKSIQNIVDEEIVISEREIYVYYPSGMGLSKLKFPNIRQKGTARNINTLTKIAELCQNK